VGRSFRAENVNKVFFFRFRFSAVKELQHFKIDVFFNTVFADFCKLEITLLM
jgi:hypothetical protein